MTKETIDITKLIINDNYSMAKFDKLHTLLGAKGLKENSCQPPINLCSHVNDVAL